MCKKNCICFEMNYTSRFELKFGTSIKLIRISTGCLKVKKRIKLCLLNKYFVRKHNYNYAVCVSHVNQYYFSRNFTS